MLSWRRDGLHIAVVTVLVGSVLGTLALGATLREPSPDELAETLTLPSRDEAPAEARSRGRTLASSGRPAAGERRDLGEAPEGGTPPGTPPASVVDTDPRSPERRPEPPTERRPAPAAREDAASPAGKTSERASLAERSQAAIDRLASRADAWTVQFMVTCDAGRAESLSQVDDDVLVLPVRLDGRRCWRICWGTFADRDAATSAGGRAPSALAALVDRPLPRPAAEVLP